MRFAPIAAAVLCLAAYAGTIGAEFVYDDYAYVVDNADLRGGAGRIPRLFASSFPSHAPERALYRPLTAATYLLERGGGGPDARRSHATNLVLAALLVLAVHAALRRVVPPAAALAGTFLFAVHPVHAEAVAWVTGRSEVLAGLFACLALAWGLDAARGRGGAGKAAAAAGALFLGMLSKENAAVAGPLLAAGLILSPALRGTGAKGALAAVASGLGAGLAVRAAALGSFAPAAGERVGSAVFVDRLPLIVAAAGEHLRLLVWPHPLFVERMTVAPVRWTDDAVLPGAAVLIAFAGLLFVLRRNRTALFLALWPVIALLPVLHLVPIGESVAERFLLLPSVGACGLAGLGLTAAGPAVRLRRAVLALLVVAGFLGTLRSASVWRTEESLWRNAVAMSPESPGAWAGLGDAYAHEGSADQAVPRYRKALQLEPGLTAARLALATALDATGRPEEALEESRTAVRNAPKHPAALNNLGARLARTGRTAEAEDLFRQAIQLSPGYAPALRNAALAALDGGRPEEARDLLQRAVAVDPALPGLDGLRARLDASSPGPGGDR